jgi:hypothetical protein
MRFGRSPQAVGKVKRPWSVNEFELRAFHLISTSHALSQYAQQMASSTIYDCQERILSWLSAAATLSWINKDGQTNRSLSTGGIPRRDGRWKGF